MSHEYLLVKNRVSTKPSLIICKKQEKGPFNNYVDKMRGEGVKNHNSMKALNASDFK